MDTRVPLGAVAGEWRGPGSAPAQGARDVGEGQGERVASPWDELPQVHPLQHCPWVEAAVPQQSDSDSCSLYCSLHCSLHCSSLYWSAFSRSEPMPWSRAVRGLAAMSYASGEGSWDQQSSTRAAKTGSECISANSFLFLLLFPFFSFWDRSDLTAGPWRLETAGRAESGPAQGAPPLRPPLPTHPLSLYPVSLPPVSLYHGRLHPVSLLLLPLPRSLAGCGGRCVLWGPGCPGWGSVRPPGWPPDSTLSFTEGEARPAPPVCTAGTGTSTSHSHWH